MKMLCRNFNCSHRMDASADKCLPRMNFCIEWIGNGCFSWFVAGSTNAACNEKKVKFKAGLDTEIRDASTKTSRGNRDSSISEGFPLHWLARKPRFFLQNFLFPFECERRILRGAAFGECGLHQSRLSLLVRYRWSSIFWRLELEWKTNLVWKSREEFRLNGERCSRMFYFYSGANGFQAYARIAFVQNCRRNCISNSEMLSKYVTSIAAMLLIGLNLPFFPSLS